jgi:hypothetical protein
MFQRLKRLKDFVVLFLRRKAGMAVLAPVQASDLSEEARARVTEILRFMLRRPDELEDESSPPDALFAARPPAPRHARRAGPPANASRRGHGLAS